MARKTKHFVIPAGLEGFERDDGKVFFLTEMPAVQAEKWAIRAFLALAKAGVDIPENIENLGFAGMAMVGLASLGGVDFAEAEPLLDELLACVEFVPDPVKTPDFRRRDFLTAGDIEEVATFLLLRREVFELHSNFSQLAGRWALTNPPKL